jgi:hypothetical protein
VEITVFLPQTVKDVLIGAYKKGEHSPKDMAVPGVSKSFRIFSVMVRIFGIACEDVLCDDLAN